MTVLIPNIKKNGEPYKWIPKSEKEGMQLNYKAGKKKGYKVLFNK